MPVPDDEAEFEHTKMSFGEHLEELRSAVFKSAGALLIGFIIGLMVGKSVVRYIQGPLVAALEDYYRDESQERLSAYLHRATEEGRPPVDDPEAAAHALADEGLALREIYVDPWMLGPILAREFPDSATALQSRGADKGAAVARKRSELIKIPILEPIEDDPRARIIALSTQEPFMVWVKASLLVGLTLSSPFIFYFIWAFIAAGLYRHERKHIYIYLPISLLLFAAGAALAYYVAFDYVLTFLLMFNRAIGVDPSIRLNEWVILVLMLPLGFGVSFQLPLFMLLLQRVGIVPTEAYTSNWKVAIVAIFVISMVLTPAGDPGSMLVMALPLVGLYYLGVLMCRHMPGSSLADAPRMRRWGKKKESS